MLEIKNLLVELKDIKIEIPHLLVEKGDYMALMGTSGAGKTVLVESIAGFYPLKRGEIYINNERIDTKPPNKRNIAIVYQDFMLFLHMTVEENIKYPLKIRKKRENIREIAELLGIEALLNRYPRTLSGGELQRCALARALVLNPEILLLDEPFSSLDRKNRENMRKLVKDVVKELAVEVIHITHDVETAWLMANKVAIMHDGKLVQIGTIDEVFSKPNPEFVADFVDANIIGGEVIGTEDSLTAVKVGNEKIYISERANGKVLLSIRPENIIVAKNRIESSMRNALRGKIIEMENRGTTVRLLLQFQGFSLVSILTPNAIHALSLKEGDEIFVYFKASSVRVV